ncbi:MAG: hypothetical protein ACXWC9_09405 [Pseudobdellovibrionaceae bacterium]
MKIFFLFLVIHVLAYSVSKAEEAGFVPSAEPTAVEGPKDDCQDVLPQVENDYSELDQKYRSLSNGSVNSQENYMTSLSQVTQVLFQMVEDREQETAMISQSRDKLRGSVEQFNQQSTLEASKNLQSDYLDLTVRLYSTLMDSQKILETLKSQISQVETTRGQVEMSRQELESLDHQKLAMEGKLISLKIKCQSERRRL